MEEATTESLLDKIKPPRLEDAGLEDCALPPEAIREAFLKAASAVRTEDEDSSDEKEAMSAPSQPKKGTTELAGGDTAADGRGPCVQGLEIVEKNKGTEDGVEKKPTLASG